MIFAWIVSAILLCRLLARRLDKIVDKKKVLWPIYAEEADQARCFRSDLRDKIWEMDNDISVSYHEWMKILEVCKYSDDWVDRTHPNMKKIPRLQDLVKEILEAD